MKMRHAIMVGIVALVAIFGFLYVMPLKFQASNPARISEATDLETHAKQAPPPSGEEQPLLAAANEHAHVLPEPLTSVPPNPESLYPELPKDVYAQHIDGANRGDAVAMYWVSKALNDCSNAPRSEEQYQQYVGSRAQQQPWWDYFRFQTDRCQSFFKLLPDTKDFGAQAEYWLEQSARAGYTTAKVEVMLDAAQFGRPPIDNPQARAEIKSLVYEDIKTRTYPAYYQMARYLEWVGDGATPESIAWNYAACRLHPGCDVSATRRSFEANYYPYEADEILRLAANIEEGRPPKSE